MMSLWDILPAYRGFANMEDRVERLHPHYAMRMRETEIEAEEDDTVRPGLQRVAVRKSTLDLAQAWAVIGIFTILAFAAIDHASTVLMPVTLAIVVGLILGLAADRLQEFGIPPMATALILSTVFVVLLFLTANALFTPLTDIAANAPAMLERAEARVLPYLERHQWLKLSPTAFSSGPLTMDALAENSGTILSTLAANVTPALVQGLIFFAALIMFLGSRHQIRRALIISFRDRARRLSAIRIINAIETALGFYFATAALLYAVAGLIMTVIAWAGGLSSPIVWGFFTFLSSFVPFLGVTGMTLALAIGGLLTHDNILLGLAPAMGFFAVHALMENLVTPAVMGRRLEINPFVVFVAIIFWTWLWGAVGAMLALPLSLISMAIAQELMPSQKFKPRLPG